MSAWAKPGVKCVCVDASFVSGPSPLTEGQVYIVARVVSAPGSRYGRYLKAGAGLVLTGVDNPYAEISNSFSPHRFRPLITRTQEQDLEHFIPLLKTKEMAE